MTKALWREGTNKLANRATEMRKVNKCSFKILEKIKSLMISDMKLGRNLARTFLDYYKMTGYISTKPSSSLTPKPSNGRHSAKNRNGERRDRAASEPVRHVSDDRLSKTNLNHPKFVVNFMKQKRGGEKKKEISGKIKIFLNIKITTFV